MGNLPGFWAAIAAVLWPGYWDPSAEWMCAPICAAPEDTVMTCDDCMMGIQMGIEQMLAAETLDTIVEFLSGDFCASMGDDRCPEFVDVVIMQLSQRLATPLWMGPAQPSSGSSE